MGQGTSSGKPTTEQQAKMNKIMAKFTPGSQGTPKFGGEYSKIVATPTFKANPDGSISYKIVGERVLPAQKSVVIGVGNLPERKRTTVSTGIITKDGLVKHNKNQTTETNA